MDLSTYITALLAENETVIIPGFGAFISVYKPAVIAENEIIPPGKEVRFFQQVKNNDGLLAMYIARLKKVSYDDAFKKIERASSKIIYQLDKGEIVTFGELGEFSYNENREIVFTPFKTGVSILSGGFEPVSIDDVIETMDESAAEPVSGQDFLNEEIAKVDERIHANDEVTPISLDEIEHKEEINEVHAEIQDSQTISPKRKRPVWGWYLLAGSVILTVLLIAFYNNKSSQFTGNKKSSVNEIKIEVISPEKNISDTILPVDTVPQTITEPAEEVPQHMFYLVGGGFKSEENADKFIKKLAETGISGIRLGKQGNMFLVGIESFKTEQEAYDELNRRMQENPEWKLWVYQK